VHQTARSFKTLPRTDRILAPEFGLLRLRRFVVQLSIATPAGLRLAPAVLGDCEAAMARRKKDQ
jgi:hypothetical protein